MVAATLLVPIKILPPFLAAHSVSVSIVAQNEKRPRSRAVTDSRRPTRVFATATRRKYWKRLHYW